MQLFRLFVVCVSATLTMNLCALAQVDPASAAQYFREAESLCAAEAGKLWGISLCGPMVLADAQTGTIATNQPEPEAIRPRALGYANTALDWGDTRWSAFVWQYLPAGDDNQTIRGRLMMHELFHRIQPELGLLITSSPGENDHLETVEGRYWMQLEWQALARALGTYGALHYYQTFQKEAVQDALAFRKARRQAFEDVSEPERISEINEGLAQYTGTVVAAGSLERAASDTILQLRAAPEKQSFVRTFSYASGAAYGILLDLWAPGWAHKITADDDLGRLLAMAMEIEPAGDVEIRARKYGGPELMQVEREREREHLERVAMYRQRFVESPVLIIPRGRGASFVTTGVTPIPDAGTIYPQFRVSGPWGELEADLILISPDQSTYRVPVPSSLEGLELTGDGWTLRLESGWEVSPGSRAGDFQVVPKNK